MTSDDRQHERELVDRARRGSVEAFDELMRMHQDALYRFLVVRGMNPADAEDVIQETFLSAWRYLHSYRPRWAFSTWLYTIARRTAGRLKSEPGPGPQPESMPAPDEQAASDERRGRLWETARGLLNDDQFTALWLYYAEELEIAEIARVLRRGRSWVKVNLHRSRNRLAAALESEGRGRTMNDEPIRT